MLAKRVFDLFFAGVGLILLIPVFIVTALFIRSDGGPVFFRQHRVGRDGRLFRIIKFRTMIANAEKQGKQITVGNDVRITRMGAVLRKYKLDELPQLLNVVAGDMSLVGPRPEVPRYVEFWPADARPLILSVPPGITDLASIEFWDENALLQAADEPETVYIEKVLPIKIQYYLKYVNERSLWLDIVLILRTIRVVFARPCKQERFTIH